MHDPHPRTAMMTTIAAALLLIAVPALARPELQETRTLELDAEGLDALRIEAGPGALVLRGDVNTDRVVVTAEIWQDKASDDFTLSLEREGDSARLLSDIESNSGRWFWGGGNDAIELDITVPAGFAVRIEDGSGSIDIHGLAGDLRIHDGSGSIKVRDVDGALDIEDGSGSLTLVDIGGDIDVEDGSGSITVENAGGRVRIDDGSGSITVENAAGVVTVRDGSGSIRVDGAADFELLEDGSGSVVRRNIGSRD
jgi:hypothetical protein